MVTEGRARRRLVVEWALLGLLVACGDEEAGRPHRPPDVVMVVVDTWRWDALGANLEGDPEARAAKTPHLDGLANQGVLFTRAIASSPWTEPSVASMLTGEYPTVHGAHGVLADVAPIRLAVPTLAETLAGAGYYNVGVVNGYFLSPDFGFDRGFDVFDYVSSSNLDIRRAGESVDAALAHLEHAPRDRPWFLFLHLFDPHLAYDPPEGWRGSAGDYEGPYADLRGMRTGRLDTSPSALERMRALYDGEVGYVDSEVGRLVQNLGTERARLLVVTADHGEEFGDHGGWEHGHSMYQELVRVPLIVVPPADRPPSRTRVDTQVRLLDLMSTALEATGLEPAPGTPSQSLFPWFEATEGAVPRDEDLPAISEKVHLGEPCLALRDGEYTLIGTPGSRRWELYSRGDPLETTDLAPGHRQELDRLRGRLRRMMRVLRDRSETFGKAEQGVEIPTGELESLRSLGYIED